MRCVRCVEAAYRVRRGFPAPTPRSCFSPALHTRRASNSSCPSVRTIPAATISASHLICISPHSSSPPPSPILLPLNPVNPNYGNLIAFKLKLCICCPSLIHPHSTSGHFRITHSHTDTHGAGSSGLIQSSIASAGSLMIVESSGIRQVCWVASASASVCVCVCVSVYRVERLYLSVVLLSILTGWIFISFGNRICGHRNRQTDTHTREAVRK